MATHPRPLLTAEPREGVRRKSEVKALRRSGQIPASVFGHGDAVPIQLLARDVKDFLRHHAQGGLLDLSLEGTSTPVLIREIDRHPITGEVMTLGLQRVDMKETLKTSVTIQFTGEDELISNGLILQRQMDSVEVHGRADLLPEAIVVDISHLGAGDNVRIGDLPLPEGVEATKDADLPVATISLPSVPADVEAALEAEEAAHEAEKAAHATETEADEEEAEDTEDAAATA
jgi:large subunit ribosomal protein L25